MVTSSVHRYPGGVCSTNVLYIEKHEFRAISREVVTGERRFKGNLEPAAKDETHEDRRGERG
jgi:predicted RNA-binding protein